MRAYLITLVGVVLAGSLLADDLFPSQARVPTQHAERRMEKKRMPSQPAKIMGVKNKKLTFPAEGDFADDDEWLDGLTVEVKNISNKAITYIEIDLDFPQFENEAPTHVAPLFFDLRYGTRKKTDGTTERPSVKPSETVRLTLSDEDYMVLKRMLAELSYPRGIKKVGMTLREVIFDDDTMWYMGNGLIRDPNNPDRWITVKRLEVSSPANDQGVKKN